MSKARRSWRALVGRLALVGSAGLAIAVLFFSLVPTMPYVPYCGSDFHPTYLRGPVRERFLILMSGVFEREDVFYVRHGNTIYLRVLPFFDGNDLFNRLDVLSNFQHRMVQNIANGTEIDDVEFPPSEALVEAMKATADEFGPYPRRDEAGRPIYGTDKRFEDCRLMRAAIIDDSPE